MSENATETVVDLTVHLRATREQVFATIADHAALPTWAPGLRRVEVDASRASPPGGVGTVRTLYPRLGSPGVETVSEFEPPRKLAYRASDASLRGLCSEHRAELTLTTDEAGGTTLRWTVALRPSPSWWRARLARWMFAWAARTSAENLRRRFGG